MNRQSNIFDFLETKDWIDSYYHVWKVKHKGEWSEYSPKFLTKEEAKEWRMTKGENLHQRFGREMKLFTCRPSEHNQSWRFLWSVEGTDRMIVKRVPGADFDDAKANIELFNPDAVFIQILNTEN